jgi:hypothetical protein
MKYFNKSTLYIIHVLLALVIFALIALCINTFRVNESISKSGIEFVPLNAQLANKASIQALLTDSSDVSITLNIDQKAFQQHLFKINESINQLKEQKRYILDGNTISFLFQVLSILLIGLGLYLLKTVTELASNIDEKSNKLSSEVEKINQQSVKLSSDIIERQLINHLINSCQIIHQYTILFKEEIINSINYDPNNLKICCYLSREHDEIINLLSANQSITIKKEDKEYCIKLLIDSKLIFEKLKLKESSPFYSGVYIQINKTIMKIKELKNS